MARTVLAKVFTLGVAASANDPAPSEFRLFKAGINDTTKGEFLFDAKAAEMVMAAAEARGQVEYAIDLEHLSLDPEARHFNPDALGHFKLAVRDGELWAVDVNWNPEGLRRLSERTQRYISPAFISDDERRVTEIHNVALVANPATQDTPALVAANRSKPRMSLKAITTLSAALTLGLAKVKLAEDAAAAAGDTAAPGKFATVKAKAEALAAAIEEFSKAIGGDPDALFAAMQAAVKACGEFESAVAAVTGAAPEVEPPGETASATEKEQQQMARERAELVALRAEKVARERDAEVQRLAAEMTERAELEAELVKMGRETPATVKLLSALPLESMRERVKQFRGPAGAVKLGGPRVPAGSGAGDGSKDITTSRGVVVTLTANQLRECERAGAKPEAFAELQASRLPVKA